MRAGIGYDVHRLEEGRPLILGGTEVPWVRGLAGHSDADVLLHAVMDALLGAAALGDIGMHFPPGEPRFKGISSLLLLAEVDALLKKNGFSVVNIDSTIVAQSPRLAPYIPAMRLNIARVLGLAQDNISVKATTTEHLGFTGREEGMAACAIALIKGA
ncbi:MAG: 2-C-methyl-D-erythritol 2,4-cyclodiphosphate synthase [Bacillota bacterium]